jgi:hypothetical protein
MIRKTKPKIVDSPITRMEAEWMEMVSNKTSRLMVEYLKASTDVHKPINTLNEVHRRALAEIARATYIGELAERRARKEELPEEAEQLDLWLLG